MASCMGIEVYRDTTSRLHGYGRVLLVVKSPAWMHLMSSRLFSRCAGTFFSIGLGVSASNYGMGCILISGPVLWVCILISRPVLWVLNLGRSVVEARKLLTKGGNLFCRQMFFQVELTLFSTVLADMRGIF